MKSPFSYLKSPKVILDYSGLFENHPEIAAALEGAAVVVHYRPGASHPVYSMCDTVAVALDDGEKPETAYLRAKKTAPRARQGIFFGREGNCDASHDSCVSVCIEDCAVPMLQ